MRQGMTVTDAEAQQRLAETYEHEDAEGTAPAAGDRIGRYRIVGQLGQGAMGRVLAAHDDQLDRRVALKLVRPIALGSATAQERLRREGVALAKLSHPNVVTVYEVGQADGLLFIAMELVEGLRLGEWLKAHDRTWEAVTDVFVQAGEGLAAAHACKLLHRDFKPDNVMVGSDARVRVVDFGIALDHGATTTRPDGSAAGEPAAVIDTRITRAGARIGTPAYMAPEQLMGRRLGPRSDQFSFCIALYEALYGERPFESNTAAELLLRIATTPPSFQGEARSAPPAVIQIVKRGLAVVPGHRFNSMDALVLALRATRKARRRPLRVLGTGVLGGALVTVGVRALLETSDPNCESEANTLQRIWDTERSAAVRAQLSATGAAYFDVAARRVTESLDAYSRDWSEQAVAICEARKSGAGGFEVVFEQKQRCLDARAREVGLVVARLLEADRDVVENVSPLLQTIVAAERCGDIEWLEAQVKPPQDSQTAVEVARLQAELDRLRIYRITRCLTGSASRGTFAGSRDRVRSPDRTKPLRVGLQRGRGRRYRHGGGALPTRVLRRRRRGRQSESSWPLASWQGGLGKPCHGCPMPR